MEDRATLSVTVDALAQANQVASGPDRYRTGAIQVGWIIEIGCKRLNLRVRPKPGIGWGLLIMVFLLIRQTVNGNGQFLSHFPKP